jgi:glycosyltransferase involved in cell wall biosynthesis
MENKIKYSICGTVYNSAEIIEKAVEPLLNLGNEFEIIITDNRSTDGTYEILKKFLPKVKSISLKCTRGLGRNKAIELAQGDIIVLIDFDVAYFNILDAVNYYENNNYKDYILLVIPTKIFCNSNIIIGRKKLFDYLEGYPDLNNAEDVYFYRKAEALNVFKSVNLNLQYKCLEIKSKKSGQESRYEKNLFKLIIRRIKATRDTIFVNNLNYKQLMEWYKLKSYIKMFFIGIPLYLSGKLLTYFIKVPKLEKEIERIKNKKFP